MCDGSFTSKGITLNLQSFSIEELIRFINVLKIKFDIDCTLHKSRNHYTVYIRFDSAKKLYHKIKNYIDYAVNNNKIEALTKYDDFYIISSLLFELNSELSKEREELKKNNVCCEGEAVEAANNKVLMNKRTVFVKTITIDNGIDINEIINNIKKS